MRESGRVGGSHAPLTSKAIWPQLLEIEGPAAPRPPPALPLRGSTDGRLCQKCPTVVLKWNQVDHSLVPALERLYRELGLMELVAEAEGTGDERHNDVRNGGWLRGTKT
jgi:hypothetical protein